MMLKPRSFGFTAFLGALSALPALSIDMNLPGVPAIERGFDASPGHGALTLSLFLWAFRLRPFSGDPSQIGLVDACQWRRDFRRFPASEAAQKLQSSVQSLERSRTRQGREEVRRTCFTSASTFSLSLPLPGRPKRSLNT